VLAAGSEFCRAGGTAALRTLISNAHESAAVRSLLPRLSRLSAAECADCFLDLKQL